MCFNNNPALEVPTSGPWTWGTLYGFPVGTTQWVYSANGKFGAGAIHVELTLEGSELQVGEDTHYFYSFSGWDLRAVKVR